ncbi:MAG TPA: hypothetical protein VN624_17840, partial [Rhodanobacter sp.]|nr:hypothetical protein [Rhodanobacter sp.]
MPPSASTFSLLKAMAIPRVRLLAQAPLGANVSVAANRKTTRPAKCRPCCAMLFRIPNPESRPLPLHRIEELVVGLGVLHLVEHELHRGQLV